jgi:ABC-2 type transport system ATP-binding protein
MMETMVELRSLGKTYRARSYPAVIAIRDVDLTVTAGQTIGVLGPPGAGKTTLIKLLGGLLKSTAGTIQMRGYDIGTERNAARQQVGTLVPERPIRFGHRTLREYLAQDAQARDREQIVLEARIDAVLHEMNLWPQRNVIVRMLSPGQQRLAALVSALIADPPILLLDEPTRDLNRAEARTILTAISNAMQGKTVVLATAHVAVAYDLCERMVVLRNGRLVAECTRSKLFTLFQQERYSIRVKGHLSDAWSEWFDGLTIVNESGDEAVISGPVADQSALHGLLARVHALNLPLLSVSRDEPKLEDVFTQLYGNT